MKEFAITFGENRGLVGIITEPKKSNSHAHIGIILLNAGMVHRIGPFRLNTLLARTLANSGYTVLRFDLSGIGDSELSISTSSNEEQAVNDIGHAIDYLKQANQTKSFILIGLCTGADNAHKAAIKYNEVKGAIYLDGYAYPTPRFYIKRYLPVLLNPRRFIHALWSIIKLIVLRVPLYPPDPLAQAEGEPTNLFVWNLPLKEKTLKELQSLIKRNVELCCIFTSGSIRQYNYRGQFKESFRKIDFGDKLQVHLFEEMDHTYILTEDREKLIRTIVDWVGVRFEPNRDEGSLSAS